MVEADKRPRTCGLVLPIHFQMTDDCDFAEKKLQREQKSDSVTFDDSD